MAARLCCVAVLLACAMHASLLTPTDAVAQQCGFEAGGAACAGAGECCSSDGTCSEDVCSAQCQQGYDGPGARCLGTVLFNGDPFFDVLASTACAGGCLSLAGGRAVSAGGVAKSLRGLHHAARSRTRTRTMTRTSRSGTSVLHCVTDTQFGGRPALVTLVCVLGWCCVSPA